MIYLTPGFRKKLADDERDYLAYADITLASGQVLNLTNTEIWQDGFQVEEAVSDDNTFGALGAAIIGAGTLIIDNTRGQYTQYDFLNADVVLSIALMIDDTTPARKETVKMGTFRVDDAQYDEATITLSLLDHMAQFDRPYSESQLGYPATLESIILDACSVCGVQLETTNFPQKNYSVKYGPTDDSCTFREVIGWAATLAGCYTKCDRNGRLCLQWFNTAALEDDTGTDGGIFDSGTPYYSTGDTVEGGSFNPWSLGDEVEGGQVTDPIPVHYIGGLYQQDICVDETVITGVVATVEDPDPEAEEDIHTYSAGQDGFIIQIDRNPLLTMDMAQSVVNRLGTQLIGLRFRKCNVQQVDDPAIEAGDVGLLFDYRNNEYPILITRVTFEIGGPQTIVCASETPSHNSSTRFTQATKSYAETRKTLKKYANNFETQLAQLARDVQNASGLYTTSVEDPDSPGSYIYCLHNKPVLAQSPVRIMVSSVGVTVTANALDDTPVWYGLRVNGDMIARILSASGVNADWIRTGILADELSNTVWNLETGTMTAKQLNIVKEISNTERITVYNGDFDFRVYNTGTGYSSKVTRTGFAVDLIQNGQQVGVFGVSSNMAMYWRRRRETVAQHEAGNMGSYVVRNNTYDFVFSQGLGTLGYSLRYNRFLKPSTEDASEQCFDSSIFDFEILGDKITHNNKTVAYTSSSSKRYKHDIKPLESEEMDPRRLLDLPAKQFVFNDDHPLQYADMAGKTLPGFIAEEVAEIYPAAAIYKDGKVESWDERRIIPGMLALIQEQEKRITKQEQEIEELKAQVKALAQAIGR